MPSDCIRGPIPAVLVREGSKERQRSIPLRRSLGPPNRGPPSRSGDGAENGLGSVRGREPLPITVLPCPYRELKQPLRRL